MKTSQYFSLVVSSLVVGGGTMLLSPPATSAILTTNTFNLSSYPLLGDRFVLSGGTGRPVHINSVTSPEFPITEIEDNDTANVKVSFVGSALPFGTPYSYEINYEDNPDGTSVLRLEDAQRIVATPTGIEEEFIATGTVSSSTSAGAKTPFSVFKQIVPSQLNGVNFIGTVFYQVPGDQFSLTNTPFTVPVTFFFSSQAIPGYLSAEQLEQLDFPPPTEIVIEPGGTITISVTPGTPSTPVPEPSVIVSLSALGLGAFLARKRLKSNTKAS